MASSPSSWASATIVGKPTRQLSLGGRMKCELAATLLHRPKVLFLDEPTIASTSRCRSRSQLHPPLQRGARRDADPDQPLNGRRRGAVPALLVIDKGRLSYDGGLTDLTKRRAPRQTESSFASRDGQRAISTRSAR